MSQLPKGWAESSLIDLTKFIDYRGRTPKKTDTGIPLITAKNIKDGYINREPREYIAESDYSEWMTRGFPKVGDVLLTTEAPLGNVAQIDIKEKFALAQRAICFQFYDVSIERFVYYYLRSPLFNQELGINSTGSTVKGIKAATLKKLPVQLAPLAEQQRIVEKLDEVLAQVDTIKARLDGIPAILKRFRQSVLAAAVSGRLIPSADSKKVKVGDVSQDIRYGTSKKCDYKGGDIPVIRIPNIGVRKLDISDLKSADFTEKEQEKLALQEGDLLVIRSNGSLDLVAKPALVEKEFEGFLFAGYLIRIRCDQKQVLPSFLLNVLCSRVVRDAVEIGARSTSGVNNINSKELASLEFILPALKEQKEIVRLVDQYFALADTIEAQVKKAQQRVDNLTQSILAKAFRGELVPQDSSDEPADKLLERIAQARIEAEALAKAAKKVEADKKRAAKKASA